MSVPKQLGIIGLGLIGGSMAKLISSCFPNTELYGLDNNNIQINAAHSSGIFKKVFNRFDELPKSLDLLIICTPIHYILDIIQTASDHFDEIVMLDCGSVKSIIHENLPQLKSGQVFLGGHPMAGSTNQGFESSDLDLLKGARFFLINHSDPKRVHIRSFLLELGFDVLDCSPSDHDLVTGLASHFPYLMATLTSNIAKSETPPDLLNLFKKTISSGFRDTTRVTTSDPKWGEAVCKANHKVIQKSLLSVKNEIDKILSLMDETSDQLFTYLKNSSDIKKDFSI